MGFRGSPSTKRGWFLGTAALFALAMVGGGLGPHAPFLASLIEAAAFPVLLAVLLFARPGCWSTGSASAAAIVALLLAVGAAQLVPLPASVWQALPGREIPLLVSDILDEPSRAWPLNLSPEDGRLVVQAFLPAVAVFFATVAADGVQRRRLAAGAIAAAALGSILALLQLSFGDGTLFLDPAPPYDRLPGLFANFNHQASFLACAVALLPAVAKRTSAGGGLFRFWPPAFWVLALLGTLATSSRAGLALFGVASVVTALRLLRRDRPRIASPTGGRLRLTTPRLAVTLALLIAIGWLAAGSYRIDLISSRFGLVGRDARFEFWAITWQAIKDVFPAGSGLGTFEAVYQIAEPLASVQDYVVNHAHNDYLEFVLELGLAGPVLITLFLAWVTTRVAAVARTDRGSEWRDLAWSGATVIALVMIHSVVDYPLRTQAVGCLFAFACGSLIAPPRLATTRDRTPDRAGSAA